MTGTNFVRKRCGLGVKSKEVQTRGLWGGTTASTWRGWLKGERLRLRPGASDARELHVGIADTATR